MFLNLLVLCSSFLFETPTSSAVELALFEYVCLIIITAASSVTIISGFVSCLNYFSIL